MGMARFAAAALACVLACAATSDTGPWWAYHELGEPVDVSRSLEAIRSVPIKRFEMTHDTVNGRVHYGVLAPDAEASLGPVYGETVTKRHGARVRVGQPRPRRRALGAHGALEARGGQAAVHARQARAEEARGQREQRGRRVKRRCVDLAAC